MIRVIAACAAPGILAAIAAGQTSVYAVRANGDLVRLDAATGTGTLIGPSGFPWGAATGGTYYAGYEVVQVAGGSGVQADQIAYLNPWTGAIVEGAGYTGRPAGYTVRGIALAYQSSYFLLLAGSAGTDPCLLARTNGQNSAITIIGSTGRTDLGPLAVAASGTLFCLGSGAGGTLCTLNPGTGAATSVGGGGFGQDTGGLAILPDGSMLACGENLLAVNPGSGQTTLIGPTGFTDIRGLAALTRSGCYADCDHAIGIPPPLTVNDFICFQIKFARGDPYCNCDQSTVQPVLNVNDFICFMSLYAAGCP